MEYSRNTVSLLSLVLRKQTSSSVVNFQFAYMEMSRCISNKRKVLDITVTMEAAWVVSAEGDFIPENMFLISITGKRRGNDLFLQ